MVNNKKLLLASTIALVLIGVYLYLAHFLIYYRLGHNSLTTFNRQAIYTIGDKGTATSSLVYIALGDSLTAGVGTSQYEESYPYQLAEKLAQGKQSQVTLENYSYPGARTSQLIKTQLDPTMTTQPDIITLLIGTNDVHGNISPANFKTNYDYVLKELTQKTSAKIYLLGLPNVGADGLLWPPYNYYFGHKTREFNQIIQALAKKYALTYIDLEKATTAAAQNHQEYYSQDLFHPSSQGYKLWTQIIYGTISK